MKIIMPRILLIIVFLHFFIINASARNNNFSSDIQKLIFNVVSRQSGDSIIIIHSQVIRTAETAASFYRKMNYHAVWVNENGFNFFAKELMLSINYAHANGLNKTDYHAAALERLEAKINRAQLKRELPVTDDLFEAEMLMTDAYLLFSAHLNYGKTDPETIDPQWHAERNDCNIELDNYLIHALQHKKIAQSLSDLEPVYCEYDFYKNELTQLNKLLKKGGWKKIDFKDVNKISKGDTSFLVPLIKERLTVSGEYNLPYEQTDSVFDESLEAAVKRFQYKNGLKVAGYVGKETMEAMNISLNERIQTIILNMERMRWLPREPESRYIVVNIAGFNMKLMENGCEVMYSNAIVGKDYRETPVFSAKMTYLVFNPTWTVPSTILANDVIPDTRRDIHYLEKKKMKVYDRNGHIVDPTTIDWKKAKGKSFPYTIRQSPGAHNSLGLIKFMFPNKYDVYMHDTPQKELFEMNDRAFSSGCIRIQKPVELAEYLLRKKEEFTPDSIQSIFKTGKTLQVILPEPIMVHIVYFTATVDEKGIVIFRKDLYGRDKKLKAALFEEYEN
jgi:murein L,D-transpeptidase YcbB/YkuD